MVSALIAIPATILPGIQTYDNLAANFPAASFTGYSAYTSDVGPVYSNGVVWSYPLTEGTYDLISASISPSAVDRYPILTGITAQEPSVWYANGVYNMIFTNGAAHLAYVSCVGDPTVNANWSSPVEVIGGGSGGEVGTCAHSFVYVEGATLYCYYITVSGGNNIKVATAAITTPTVFGSNATVFTGVPVGSTDGNTCVFKSGSTYYMLQECLCNNTFPVEGSTNTWQITLLTCATATGTFAFVGQQTSLRPSPNASTSGAWATVVGSNVVVYYHAGTYGRVFPNDIYRATIPVANLGTDTWTLSGAPLIPLTFNVAPSGTGPGTLNRVWLWKSGNYNTTLSTGQVISMTYTAASTSVTWSTTVTGTPTTVVTVAGLYPVNNAIMKRAHYYDFDQIADPYVATGPNGVSYLFYEGATNRTPSVFQMMITPLLPTPVQNDGPYGHLILGARYPQAAYWNTDDAWSYSNLPLPMVSGQANAAVNAARTNGTWAIVATTGAPNGSVRTNTSAASGDFIEYDVTCSPGTYTLNLNYQQGPANGIYSITLYDGASLAPSAKTVDSYAASTAYASTTITNFWILGYETFRWRLRLACTSKNASSSAFAMADCGFTLQRTGN